MASTRPTSLGQLMHHPDAADADGPHLVGQLHADVAWLRTSADLDPPAPPPTAARSAAWIFCKRFLYPGLHSKSSLSPG